MFDELKLSPDHDKKWQSVSDNCMPVKTMSHFAMIAFSRPL